MKERNNKRTEELKEAKTSLRICGRGSFSMSKREEE